MSSPMFDLPEHMKIGLTKEGWGPALDDDRDFDHWGCWCGVEGCEKYE